MQTNQVTDSQGPPAPIVAPGPHFGTTGRSTQWMMLDVIIALIPVVAMSFYVFGVRAGMVIGWSVGACLATEAVFEWLRHRRVTLFDGSAAVTGLILALSLPWTSPWWIPAIGGVAAIAIGKMVFGGLGHNLFNPAMVGRAFVAICFAAQLGNYTLPAEQPGGPLTTPPGAVTEVRTAGGIDAVTTATPMTAGKMELKRYSLTHLLIGTVNGSLGETSALLLILGGLYLCTRRSAAWQIPAGALIAAMVFATAHWLLASQAVLTPGHHLLGGSLLLGAFFIATDPVSSPVSVRGRWIFGLGFGAMVMTIRLFSGYPEGVMFAVLLMNSVTPLINRWTIPVPVGGRPPRPKASAG